MKDLERYGKAIAYLDELATLPVKDDYMQGSSRPAVFLKRTAYFLKQLGNPQEDFKYVHIAGTSGKGTVTEMVHDALAASDTRAGSFTSPYVTAAIEKIRVGELYMAPAEFADIVEEFKPHIEAAKDGPHGRPTYFEIFFAIALVYFKRQKCEWVVLEVGLGGRYDATNVIEHPVVTAVTNIDYDHVHLLGKTLLSIANNKIGIVKKESAFFTIEKRPALLKLFETRCNDVGAKFHALPAQDDYQENNKRLAGAICRYIGISDSVAMRAIEKSRLPCRFEIMQENPYIILDGAHNPAKIRSTVANLKKLTYDKLHLIIGINALKDASALMKEIVPLADSMYVTSFNRTGIDSAKPEELAQEARTHAKSDALITVCDDPLRALEDATKAAKKNDAVLGTGSFYLCGELRERWYPEEWVLKHRMSFR